MDISGAKKIMGKNFIGPQELKKISSQLGISDPFKSKHLMPPILFSSDYLKKICKDYILILGMPTAKGGEKLTINKMRAIFGRDPGKKEPCFYNQDWYIKEKFASAITLDFKWYVISRKITEESRGQNPVLIAEGLPKNEKFPLAVLTAFTFFAYYFHSAGEILWKHDFIWCSDKDNSGDQIYTGRYEDQNHINKNGFNIHRHLAIRPYYGLAPQLK